MKEILGINNENFINTMLSKKIFSLKLTNCQPQTTHLTVSQVTYCALGTSRKTYDLVVSFILSQRIQYKKIVNSVTDRFKIPLIDEVGNEISIILRYQLSCTLFDFF